MALIDTHTHLDSFARRGELPQILGRARDSGIEALVTIGTSPEDWSLYREIARDHAGLVHYSVGLHPCAVEANWEKALAQVEDFWTKTAQGPRPVALGEIGLDRFHLPADTLEAEKIFGWQQAAFAEGLAIAKRLACPIVVHSRGAFRESVAMIDSSGVDWSRVVFHCFTEGETEMVELARRGGFGSFTGILTYKNAAGVRAAAKSQGLDRCMIETDAPYLTPMPHRGKPNEPAYLRHTAEFSADHVFEVPLDILAAGTTARARMFYGI